MIGKGIDMNKRIIITSFLTLLFSFSAVIASDIQLNSLRYLQDMPKKASIVKECSEFTVKKASDESVVYSGKTTAPVHQDDVNQDIWTADFSKFGEKGKFYLDERNNDLCNEEIEKHKGVADVMKEEGKTEEEIKEHFKGKWNDYIDRVEYIIETWDNFELKEMIEDFIINL